MPAETRPRRLPREWPAHRFAWGDRLRAAMGERGLTKPDLARRSGVSQQMIGFMLEGRREGRPAVHAALADALDEDPGWIFPRSGLELARAEEVRQQARALDRPPKRRGLNVAHHYPWRDTQEVAGL